ncbi:ATP-dependent zinc metalloprotease FtsH-like protein, partial [Trifolium pratense]
MNLQISNSIDSSLQLPKPLSSHKTIFFTQFPHSSLSQHILRTKFPHNKNPRKCKLRITASNSLSLSSSNQQDSESIQLFEKLKESERERVNELEELERKANVQLDRQLVMASSWNRALLTLRGKLKGTEWDPENSHRIDF